MFDIIYTYSLSDFRRLYPNIEILNDSVLDPSYFVRVGHVVGSDNTVEIEFSPTSTDWDYVK